MAKAKKGDGLSVAWTEEGSYPVRIVEDLFDPANEALAEMLRKVTGVETPRILLVADANVVQRTEGLGSRIGRYLQDHGLPLAGAPVVLGGGEKVKADNFQGVLTVVGAALDAKIGVTDAIVAIGGGAVLDVAGFAAAQVRGGLKLVRVPTTVAAMTDGAFAETACVNHAGVKDALRVPSRPAAVLIDPKFLSTVLDGVWRGGVGEMVRQAAVSDGALLRKLAKAAPALKERDASAMSELLAATVESRVKKGTTGFALWSAARLEAMSGYKLPHGYAVPMAICIDCAYAVEKGLLDEEDQETVCRVLAECGALDGLAHSRHLMSQPDTILLGLDAWRLSTGSESIVLPSGIGKSKVEPAPDREIYKKVLKEFLEVSAES